MPPLKFPPSIISTRKSAIKRADDARDRQDAAEAAALYQAVINRWGSHFGILVQLGNAYKDSGAFNKAEQAYKSALELKPKDADCHLQYGHLMKLSGDLSRARKFYAEAGRLDPGLSAAHAELRALEPAAASDPAGASGDVSIVQGSAVEMPPAKEIVQSSRRSGDADIDAPSLVVCERLFTTFTWRRN